MVLGADFPLTYGNSRFDVNSQAVRLCSAIIRMPDFCSSSKDLQAETITFKSES